MVLFSANRIHALTFLFQEEAVNSTLATQNRDLQNTEDGMLRIRIDNENLAKI